MSRLYYAALEAAKKKLHAQYPSKADAFCSKISAAALSDPDNNVFYASIEWPTDGDQFSLVGLRANFPGERLKNGQGYVGLTFFYAEQAGSARREHRLCIVYGIGDHGLLAPLSTSLSKGHIIKPSWLPASPEATAVILAAFGITATT